VNAEFEELAEGLEAAERALKPGGALAVVSFHSLEDRVVKRFLQLRAGRPGRAAATPPAAPSRRGSTLISRRAIAADEAECAANPRARSAKLRVARRTEAPPAAVDRSPRWACRPLPVRKGAADAFGLLYLLSAAGGDGAGVWAYDENHHPAGARRAARPAPRNPRLREAIGVQRAEWAYLNRPERLRELAEDEFHAAGPDADGRQQFGRIDEIAYPLLTNRDPPLPGADPDAGPRRIRCDPHSAAPAARILDARAQGRNPLKASSARTCACATSRCAISARRGRNGGCCSWRRSSFMGFALIGARMGMLAMPPPIEPELPGEDIAAERADIVTATAGCWRPTW
jgi:hypothetical protein